MRLVKQAVKTLIPQRYHFAVRSAGLRMLYAGNNRYCPCCNSRVRRFNGFGPESNPRPDAQCPVCAGLERDRLVARFFGRYPGLLEEVERVLHVAPERAIAQMFKSRRRIDYRSISLERGAAVEVMDLTDLHFDDESFDAVYCSNVLEHIERDDEAMREIHRVLRPGGWAAILVPLYGDRTHEDLSIADPEERARLYGQPDHVRAYGIDIAEKLAGAGLHVWVEQPALDLADDEARRLGVDPNEIIFLCRKPTPGAQIPRVLGEAKNFVPAYGRQPALRNRFHAAYQVNPHLVAAWQRRQDSAAARRRRQRSR